MTPQERAVIEHFQQNHRREPDGRFTVPLPRKPNLQPIGESREQALKHFNHIERSLHSKEKFSEVDTVIKGWDMQNRFQSQISTRSRQTRTTCQYTSYTSSLVPPRRLELCLTHQQNLVPGYRTTTLYKSDLPCLMFLFASAATELLSWQMYQRCIAQWVSLKKTKTFINFYGGVNPSRTSWTTG